MPVRNGLRTGSVRVRVPATSANLGPGFDAFGLALTLYDEIVAAVDPDGGSVSVEGEGAGEVPTDDSHLVLRSMRTGFDRLGVHAGGVRLACRNRIPHGRGLGSSAAAIVGGLLAARALVVDGVRRLPDDALLAEASAVEGHPDNVAACLLGGLTIAWSDDAGPRAVRLPVHRSVRPVALVPEQRSLTKAARGLLPAQVPHGDAAANAARAALLVEAFGRRPELLMAATEDRLHQSYRAEAMPDSLDLVARLRGDGVPAVLSGAGPTVLALVGRDGMPTVRRLAPGGWQVLPLSVSARGARALRGPAGGE